jgi:hypothetical protein
MRHPIAMLTSSLAFATPALGQVVWRDTPGISFQFTAPNQSTELPLDLDLDGTDDFVLIGQSPNPSTPAYWGCAVNGVGTSRVLCYWVDSPQWTGLANRYASGETVGPGPAASRGVTLSYFTHADDSSPDQLLYAWGFEGRTSGFMGLALVSPSDGLIRYGWLELTTNFARSPTSLSVTIGRVAYETTPATPIIAGAIPAPATLVMIALPLVVRRRR